MRESSGWLEQMKRSARHKGCQLPETAVTMHFRVPWASSLCLLRTPIRKEKGLDLVSQLEVSI